MSLTQASPWLPEHSQEAHLYPHVCLETFPHGLSTSHPMLEALLKEPWRIIGRVPFYSHLCGQTHSVAMLPLSTLMTRGSPNMVQKSLILKQCLSGEHTTSYFPRPLMSPLPCRRLWVHNKGETYFPDPDFSELIPRHRLGLVFCLGCVLMGITISPQRTLTEGGPALSTGCETFMCVSSQQQHLGWSPLNNT